MIAHLPRFLDDDNLTASLKPVRDELADWLGVDDADPRVRWECGQVESHGTPGVTVRIERVGTPDCKNPEPPVVRNLFL